MCAWRGAYNYNGGLAIAYTTAIFIEGFDPLRNRICVFRPPLSLRDQRRPAQRIRVVGVQC